MQSLIRGAAVACMLAATPAWGDGLPSSRYAAPPAISQSWACYVGIGATGGFAREPTTMMGIMSLDQGAAAYGVSPNGGCDWLQSWGVIGIEGEYNVQSGKIVNNLLGLNGSIPITNEWAINGRLGMYTSRTQATLLYIKGGYTGTGSTAMTLGTFTSPFGGLSGPDAGVGIETVLAQYGSLKLTAYGEYTHEWLGSSSSTLSGIVPTKITEDVDRVTAGLRIRF